MIDWTAIAGIAGTIIAATLSPFVQVRIARSQQAAADRKEYREQVVQAHKLILKECGNLHRKTHTVGEFKMMVHESLIWLDDELGTELTAMIEQLDEGKPYEEQLGKVYALLRDKTKMLYDSKNTRK